MQRFGQFRIYVLTLVVLLFTAALAYAVPQTVNYQGYLTDASGPVDGTVEMTLRIYDAETDGVLLWEETHTGVAVNQGVYNVLIGSGTNTVETPDMFSYVALWFETVVNGETMAPRQKMASVVFAFRAEEADHAVNADDADTVDGQHAGEFASSSHSHAGSDIVSSVGDADTVDGVHAPALEESAEIDADIETHRNIADAHHAKTTSFSELTDTATDAQVPDTITVNNAMNADTVDGAHAAALEESAEIDADIASHGSNASAHHSRYSDAEAVNAMGAVSDSNPLNHTKYTSADAVTAIKAADGAGSTLDADMVDGLQANEIIDAAQDEVRTPISSLPFTIATSGSYYLTGNLDGSSGGIDITADDVTLDLMGFTINGGGAVNDYGIYLDGYSNITIINGTIKGFGKAGIFQSNSTARYATVMDLKALTNGTLGTTARDSGIILNSSNSHVERCTAGDNGGYGIYAGTSSKLVNNTAYSNSGIYGIYGNLGSTLIGNTAYSNSGTYGIYGNTGSTLIGNTAYSNSGNGIGSGLGTNLIRNTAYENSHWGIHTSGTNFVKDNMLFYNNVSRTTGEGGLRVDDDSRVVGNTLDSNEGYNIYVASDDNVLKDNHVTDSANGIFFNVSGNYYRDNTASGNTINFNLNGTTQTDGGGNAGF